MNTLNYRLLNLKCVSSLCVLSVDSSLHFWMFAIFGVAAFVESSKSVPYEAPWAAYVAHTLCFGTELKCVQVLVCDFL